MRSLVIRTETPRLVAGLLYARATGRPGTFPGAPLVLRGDPAEPKLSEGQVRVGTLLGGICGSDLRVLRVEVSRKSTVAAARRSGLGRLLYPGHEAVGMVLAVGPKVERFCEGQRVVMIPGVFCSALGLDPPCAFCAEGQYSLCRSRQERDGTNVGGGWSDTFLRHESQLFPVPEGMGDETAALIEPLASSVHAVLRRPPRPNDRVLVVGVGMIGLGTVSALRALERDLDITVLARHAFQSECARRLGANRAVVAGEADAYEELARAIGTSVAGWGRASRYLVDGFDAVYDAVGTAATLQDALRWCRPRGFVALVGIDLFPGTLDRTPVWRNEIDVVGAVGHGSDDYEGSRLTTFQRVTDWLQAGRLRAEGLATHRFALADYRRALRTACGKAASGAIRVLFDFR